MKDKFNQSVNYHSIAEAGGELEALDQPSSRISTSLPYYFEIEMEMP
jgi:hypothetical protein